MIDPERAYIKDEIDVKAKEIYHRDHPFKCWPPTRPGGFLDDCEIASWERFREKAKAELEGV